MIVTYQISNLTTRQQPVHIALGVFDGIHIGHQAVIKTAIDAAKQSGGIAGVMTFDPHPIRVVAPMKAPKSILASISHKALILSENNSDFLLVQKFDEAFAAQSAKVFISELKSSCPGLASISVGEDWQFGKGREGTVESLKLWGEEFGFEVFAVAPVMNDGERVSSTRIRQAIRDGDIPAIEEMLGRPYVVFGEVLKGRQLARQLGYPTANIKVENEQLPPDGVWMVELKYKGEWIEGIGNLGKRPTIENDTAAQRLLEVHLFDNDLDLYGEELYVKFINYIRKEIKFDSVDELKSQIQTDVASVKKQFAESRI